MDTSTIINSAKSINNLMNGNKEKGIPGATEILNGLRSESGWERLQTIAKVISLGLGLGA